MNSRCFLLLNTPPDDEDGGLAELEARPKWLKVGEETFILPTVISVTSFEIQSCVNIKKLK